MLLFCLCLRLRNPPLSSDTLRRGPRLESECLRGRERGQRRGLVAIWSDSPSPGHQRGGWLVGPGGWETGDRRGEERSRLSASPISQALPCLIRGLCSDTTPHTTTPPPSLSSCATKHTMEKKRERGGNGHLQAKQITTTSGLILHRNHFERSLSLSRPHLLPHPISLCGLGLREAKKIPER